MRVERLPLVRPIIEWGADDSVFDALLVSGPLLIILLSLLGRSPITVAIVVGYLGVFTAHVLYKWITKPASSRPAI